MPDIENKLSTIRISCLPENVEVLASRGGERLADLGVVHDQISGVCQAVGSDQDRKAVELVLDLEVSHVIVIGRSRVFDEKGANITFEELAGQLLDLQN